MFSWRALKPAASPPPSTDVEDTDSDPDPDPDAALSPSPPATPTAPSEDGFDAAVDGEADDDGEEEGEEEEDYDGEDHDGGEVVVDLLPKKLRNVLAWKVSKFTPRVVKATFTRANFRLIKTGRLWIGYWGKHVAAERFKKVEPWKKVNHFPMSFECGRKDKLWINYARMKERFGIKHFDYLPETFLLPTQRRRLKSVFHTHPLWIMKPPASARGNGIRLLTTWSDLPRKRDLIVSRYVMQPLLIAGRKFDLRLYVVVTSFEPLRL
ncbi:tubulin-tyrosine ligase family-domain-containing protein, partial [Blyttiomyces helicus]